MDLFICDVDSARKKVLNYNQHLQCELIAVYKLGQPDHVTYQLT